MHDPYNAPSVPAASTSHPRVQHRWLVILSCWLAILLEFLPTEADLMFSLSVPQPNLAAILAIKVLFLSAIFGPLAIFVKLNGRKALWLMPARVLTIFVVTGMSLAVFAIILYRALT